MSIITRTTIVRRTGCVWPSLSGLVYLRRGAHLETKPSSEQAQENFPKRTSARGYQLAGVAGVLVLSMGGFYIYNKYKIWPDDHVNKRMGSKGAAMEHVDQRPRGYEDYKQVYDAIAHKLEDEDEYDDGSYGPVLLRLAWHASGTYDAKDMSGGSGFGTMRFQKEYGTDSNKGLQNAKGFLEPIKNQFDWISYGDLYTLGGVAAVQQLGGPTIRWRRGRVDGDESKVVSDGRLPDGAKDETHVRDIFYRMGFSDREIVALIGAHVLGRCHRENSGFEGPWSFNPTYFNNAYFQLLVDEKWHWRKWDGPKQLQDDSSNSLMMLPTDYALFKDKSFRKHVEAFAKDNELFFTEFSKAFSKLLELGVKFDEGAEYYEFKVWA